MDKRFYRFLQATCCNWRNSFFIDCQRCDGCSGFLLSANHNAVPAIIPVAVFEELSGETVDKYDCIGKPKEGGEHSEKSQYPLPQLRS